MQVHSSSHNNNPWTTMPQQLSPAQVTWMLRPISEWSHVLCTTNCHSAKLTEQLPRQDTTCFRCGEKGHKKQECRTWKTKLCTNPVCTLGIGCAFAHGDVELRQPWLAKCVRVIRTEGHMQVIGCGTVGRTFRECCQNDHNDHTSTKKNQWSFTRL